MSWGSSKIEIACLLKYKLRQEEYTHGEKFRITRQSFVFWKILPQIEHRAEHNSKDGVMVFHVDFSVTFSIRYQKRNILKTRGNIFNNKLWFASKGNTHVNILNLNARTKGHNFVRLEQEATSNVNKRCTFFGPMQTYPIYGDMCISGSQTKLDESWTVGRNKQKKIPM